MMTPQRALALESDLGEANDSLLSRLGKEKAPHFFQLLSHDLPAAFFMLEGGECMKR